MISRQEVKSLWKACVVAVIAVFFSVVAPAHQPVAANNSTNSAITNILCNAVNQLTGGIGRAIAIIIIISLAIMLFIGKVSWGMAIAVAVGMGILFGAKDVVNLLSGATACNS
jgi:type IV secretion system protein VirB2